MPRLFVAVWPPADVAETLAALTRPALPGLRWTRPERLHITLRFLGECDIDEARTALEGLGGPASWEGSGGSGEPADSGGARDRSGSEGLGDSASTGGSGEPAGSGGARNRSGSEGLGDSASTGGSGDRWFPEITATLGPGLQRLGRGVLMLAVHGLDELAAAVVEATRFIGDPPADQPFCGHMTMARLRKPRPSTELPEWPRLHESFEVVEFSLVESTPWGAYAQVAGFPLSPRS